MTAERDEILVVLMEECSEVIQEASKLIRFNDTDQDRIEKEIGDLICMIEILGQKGIIDTSVLVDHMNAKRDKLKTWSNIDLQ